jgi:hypothetical protein
MDTVFDANFGHVFAQQAFVPKVRAFVEMRISMRHICNGNDSRPILLDTLIGPETEFKRLGGPAAY